MKKLYLFLFFCITAINSDNAKYVIVYDKGTKDTKLILNRPKEYATIIEIDSTKKEQEDDIEQFFFNEFFKNPKKIGDTVLTDGWEEGAYVLLEEGKISKVVEKR